MARLLSKLTYANVVASLALFVALAGGTAFAASQLEKESIGTKQLKKEAVTPLKLSKKAKATLTGPTGVQGPKGDPGANGEKGARGETGPSDGYFDQPNMVTTPINESGTDFGAVNVTPGSYIVTGVGRLISTGSGASNAECALRNPSGGNGEFMNVNLTGASDRKIVSTLWAQTVSAPATFTLLCYTTTPSAVSVDEVSIAAVKVGTLH